MSLVRDPPLRRLPSKDRSDSTSTDADRRFFRQDDFISASQGLVRYLACDRATGLEVSWHEVILDRWPSPEELPSLQSQLEHLKQLRHDFLFSLHHYWISPESRRIVLISDAIPAKSVVEDFVRDNSIVRPKVVARWFRPMLEVLRYLHHLSPPVVHGRIQPGSIFVRGPSIKVDLPLFVFPGAVGFSITPFTPPEALLGEVTPASDIWAFGMALLSVVSRQTPYAECKTPIDLVRKLRNYELPDCLAAVEDGTARELIQACLTGVVRRATADELVGHQYFTRDFSADAEKVPEGRGMVVIFKSKPTGGTNQETQALDGKSQRARGRIVPN